jgi:hypothetical protein
MNLGWSSDLLVLSGRRPAGEALVQIHRATVEWVIVESSDGLRRFVFRRRELQVHPRLVDRRTRGRDVVHAPLEEVLDLHQATPSLVVSRRADAPPPERSLPDPDLPPTGRRLVELDATGAPIAVGGEDVRRKASQRGFESTIPLAPPAASAPGPTPPSRWSLAPAAPPPPAPPSPPSPAPAAATPSPPVDDEGTSPVRHPAIEPEGPVRSGAPVVLVVDLLRQPAPTAAGPPIQLGPQAADWATIEIAVSLLSPAIDFEDGGRSRIVIRRNRDSLAARIPGRVRADVAAGTEIDVVAQFWCGCRFSGAATRRLVVSDTPAHAPATAPVDRPPALPLPAAPAGPADSAGPPPPTLGAVQVDRMAEAPDLTVFITLLEPATPGRMHWRMVTPPFDRLPPRLDGRVDLGRDPAAEAAVLFKQFANLVRGQHRARIEGFGEKLWDRAPAEFHAVYWALHDHYRRPLVLQFVSDDPHLPWELMRPYRDGEVHPPLALRHAVARWIGRWHGYMRNRLPSGSLIAIAPHPRNPALQLPLAEAAARRLESSLGARRLPGTVEALRDLLENPPAATVALLHFSGHGAFPADAAASSFIKLENGSLAVEEVGRREVKLGEAHGTLVMFNACEVGATAQSLGATGGWADAFLSRRFGAFIAPLWAIEEEDAAQVTEELVTRLVTERAPPRRRPPRPPRQIRRRLPHLLLLPRLRRRHRPTRPPMSHPPFDPATHPVEALAARCGRGEIDLPTACHLAAQPGFADALDDRHIATLCASVRHLTQRQDHRAATLVGELLVLAAASRAEDPGSLAALDDAELTWVHAVTAALGTDPDWRRYASARAAGNRVLERARTRPNPVALAGAHEELAGLHLHPLHAHYTGDAGWPAVVAEWYRRGDSAADAAGIADRYPRTEEALDRAREHYARWAELARGHARGSALRGQVTAGEWLARVRGEPHPAPHPRTRRRSPGPPRSHRGSPRHHLPPRPPRCRRAHPPTRPP